jgi:hypothetical protein
LFPSLTGRPQNTSSLSHLNPPISSGCNLVYGYIVDRNSRKNVSICSTRNIPSGQQHYESMTEKIYVSQTNQLQIVTKTDVAHKFVIRIEGLMLNSFLFTAVYSWMSYCCVWIEIRASGSSSRKCSSINVQIRLSKKNGRARNSGSSELLKMRSVNSVERTSKFHSAING